MNHSGQSASASVRLLADAVVFTHVLLHSSSVHGSSSVAGVGGEKLDWIDRSSQLMGIEHYTGYDYWATLSECSYRRIILAVSTVLVSRLCSVGWRQLKVFLYIPIKQVVLDVLSFPGRCSGVFIVKL